MRVTHRWDDGDGYVYRIEDAPEPAFAIDPTAFAERACTTSNPDVRKEQERWVAAALAASGYLLSGPDGPTRNMRLPDGTRGRLYVLTGIANPVGLAQVAKGLRNEARVRDDVTGYPHGEGGRVIAPPLRIRPWDYQMDLDRPAAEGDRWYQAVLERHDT